LHRRAAHATFSRMGLFADPTRLRRLLLIGVLAASALISAMQIAAEFYNGRFEPDFTVFWAAARMAPDQLYDFTTVTAAQAAYIATEGLRPWIYPPSFLPWLTPLGGLPLWWAFAAWTLATGGLFAWALRAAAGSWKVPLVALACPAVMFCLLSGQTSFLIGAAMLGGTLLIPKRPLLAGLLFAIAATIKPQAVNLVPLALIAGAHWRALGSALLSGALIGAASYLSTPGLWADWLDATQRFLLVAKSLGISHRSLGATGLAALLGLGGPALWALVVAAAVLAVALVWQAWRATDDVVLRAAALAAGCLLVSPYAMGYDAALLATMGLALLMDRDRPLGMWVAGAALVTAAGPTVVAAGAALLLAAVARLEHRGARIAQAGAAASIRQQG